MSQAEPVADKNKDVRIRIVQEIIGSEISYQKHLQLLIERFAEPLKKNALIPSALYDSLFGSLEPISAVGRELLSSLQRGLVVEEFLQLGPFLKLYSSHAYGLRFGQRALQELEEKNDALRHFIKRQEMLPIMQGLKLPALLITPIQRIPRYKLLLEELLNHTDPSSPQMELLRAAIRSVGRSADHLNDSLAEQEALQQMLQLQQRLRGLSVVVPGRRLVKEGPVMRVQGSHRVRPCHLVLLSDLLLVCHTLAGQKLECVWAMPVQHCNLERLLRGLMKISCKEQSFLFYTEQPGEIDRWIMAIETASRTYRENRQTLRRESSACSPMNRATMKRKHMDHPNTPLSPSRTPIVVKKALAMPHSPSVKKALFSCFQAPVRRILTPNKVFPIDSHFGSPEKRPPTEATNWVLCQLGQARDDSFQECSESNV